MTVHTYATLSLTLSAICIIMSRLALLQALYSSKPFSPITFCMSCVVPRNSNSLCSLTMFCLLDFGGCALVLAAVYGDKTYRKVKILAGVLSIQLRQCWDNSNLGLKPYK